MEAMCELENDLLEFEMNVTQKIGLLGLTGTREIPNLEVQQVSLLVEIQQLHEAIVTGKLNKFERNPSEKYHSCSKFERTSFREDYTEVYSHLEKIADCVSRRIDAKRNSANSRLVFAISCVAVIVAGFSIGLQLV